MSRIKNRISDIENYKKTYDALMERKNLVLVPYSYDKKMIPVIYIWIEDICNKDNKIGSGKYSPKDYFILIVALLYSPRVFAGFTIERGIRRIIASTLNLSSTHITNSLKSVCNWYKVYADFRISVEYIYEKIINRINDE